MDESMRGIIKAIQKEIEGKGDFYILYLDDEEGVLQAFSELAAGLGLKFFCTASSGEALDFVQKRHQDLALIVSDLMMPNMDGFLFREKVLAIAPNVPFAILSGFIDKDIALKGVEHKIVAFIDKPVEPEKLGALLSKDGIPRIQAIKEKRELKAGFISEVEALIEKAEGLLLHLEQEPTDKEALNQFFGIAHTIKGASSFFEPKHLHKFVHRYEEVLKLLQRGELIWSEGVSSALFRGFDAVKELFGEFRTGQFKDRDFEGLLKVLDFEKSNSVVGLPTGSDSAAKAAKPGEPVVAVTKAEADIKVAVSLLDEFMQLSGEVTVIRNMLNKCVRSIERQYTGDRDVAMLAELLQELHKINGGVQSKITEIRKVPIKSILRTLPRAVRDVSRSLKKEVELVTTGEELRVDTSIAEVLSNSLLHIVKNSIDHGLETPAERTAAGKPSKGRVHVSAGTKNDQVVVEIEDDGKGLSLEAISNKLLKNGTHTPAQIKAMTPAELYAMIFASGFSTAAAVTDISGRGVGMSMVKDSVDAVGGTIEIESNPGKGAKFRLLLPIPKSVLIASCLSVRIGGMQFGLLQDDVTRVLQLDSAQQREFIRELTGSRALLLEGELIPIADMSKMLSLNPEDALTSTDSNLRLIVLQSVQDGRRVSLLVDRILDVEDTVVKALPLQLNSHSLYRGATFLDDGTVGMVLSTTGILDKMQIERKGASARGRKDLHSAKADAAIQSVKNALLFNLVAPGMFAIEQSDIFRIEEIDRERIRLSGKAQVVPYREGLIQIVDVSDLFSDLKMPTPIQSAQSGPVQVVVVDQGGRKLGLRVERILDMAPVESFETDLASESRATAGHFLYQGKTVALLSLAQVAEKLAAPSRAAAA